MTQTSQKGNQGIHSVAQLILQIFPAHVLIRLFYYCGNQKFIIKGEDTNQGITTRQFLHSKNTILTINHNLAS